MAKRTHRSIIAGGADLLQPLEEKGMMCDDDVASLVDGFVEYGFCDINTTEYPSRFDRRVANLQAAVIVALLKRRRELLGYCFPYLIYRYH